VWRREGRVTEISDHLLGHGAVDSSSWVSRVQQMGSAPVVERSARRAGGETAEREGPEVESHEVDVHRHPRHTELRASE
jgi:hypothetical protein